MTTSARIADQIARYKPRCLAANGEEAYGISVYCRRDDLSLRWQARNTSASPVALREIVLANIEHGLPSTSGFYGEGFSMFCATMGTLEAPIQVDPAYSDEKHYRVTRSAPGATAWNYAVVRPTSDQTILVGFSTCRRFHGALTWNARTLEVALVTEGLELAPGDSWDLEELHVDDGTNEDALFAAFTERITRNHPRLDWPTPPTGWCSWYGYGPGISSEIISDNLRAMRSNLPELRFVQIDDGYQPWMGDWLETGSLFPGGVEPVVRAIRNAGFEPAIWVAPFIASPQSRLFREHPEWFVSGDDGNPLSAEGVTFGGWRQGPWYMIDGSNPGARAHLTGIFRAMRDWGVTYFKLDANVWGSLPFGRHHDPSASSVEAYRRGMAAVIAGAGADAFILGCNHAYWPSLGLIHGSRTSYDIVNSFAGFARVARENLLRNWMNDRLWWNDPDCLLLSRPTDASELDPISRDREEHRRQIITGDRLSFHLAATLASGGMMLSGDRLVAYQPEQWDLLERSLSGPKQAAVFNRQLTQGEVVDGENRLVFLLNWEDAPSTRILTLAGRATVSDFWTDECHGSHQDSFTILLPPTSGRVLRVAADR